MPEDDNGSTEPTQTRYGSIVGVGLLPSEFSIQTPGYQGVAEEEEED